MLDIDWYYIISCQKQANLLINPIITISHLICHLFTILISFTLDLIHFFRKKSSYDTSNHLRKRESQAWNCKPLLLIKINSICGATAVTATKFCEHYNDEGTYSLRRKDNALIDETNAQLSSHLVQPSFLSFSPLSFLFTLLPMRARFAHFANGRSLLNETKRNPKRERERDREEKERKKESSGKQTEKHVRDKNTKDEDNERKMVGRRST